MDAYITRTVQAYERDTARYEAATRAMDATVELDRFTALLPLDSLPVLDAGCAFGRDSALLADRGTEVVGIDLAAGFIQRARELRPDIRFERMDVRALELPDASLAGVWCQATLLHLRDEHVAEALGEFARVLVPGGVLFAGFKAGSGEEVTVEGFSSDGARFFRYQSPESVRGLLEAAGFRVLNVRTENERRRFGPGYRDIDWIHAFAVVPGGGPPGR
ncbi:class I SAM-dependent methyltransferase [Streptomyces meridianus]|uniref:Class I SAM-dependent methyltransferase n=1 Tax=Streptomyces meridianus TaxID=2938945 RepID=A0ABT0X423_9ACTN|nr:class I SAM-dependent methyltransferase [Streptomyces meridianus]MCM2577291.1 class I SAM-dependent methyltransferase [Streptomyces meridianus]